MTKYIGYALLIAAGVAGWMGIRVFVVPLLAFASTLAFSDHRRRTVKGTPQLAERNSLADLVFLFASQCLIMFFGFLLGVFIASPGGEQFAGFLGLR